MKYNLRLRNQVTYKSPGLEKVVCKSEISATGNKFKKKKKKNKFKKFKKITNELKCFTRLALHSVNLFDWDHLDQVINSGDKLG